MARVTVLGGGGFIGANLAARLVREGHTVTVVDVEFPSFRRRALEDCDQWQLDLRDLSAAMVATAGAEVVYHLAADMGGVGYFHGPADLGATLNNGQITSNVVRAVLASDSVERLFYSSSACVYPIELQDVVHDESQIGFGTPDALYGADKLHGLRLMSKVPQARVGVLDTVYGPLQEHEGRRMKFPAAVATKALAARRTGTLELWGDGEQRRAYHYIDDAVEMIMQVTNADRYDGPVNIGAPHTVTCRQIARTCLDIAGVPDATITTNPAEPSGVLARGCSQGKYERLYGPAPVRSYRDGFGEFMGWLDGLDAPTTATRTAPDRAVMPKATVR